MLEEEEKSIAVGGNSGENPNGDGLEERDVEDLTGEHEGAKVPLTGKKDGDGNDDASATECQASQIILCDTGKSFGGKHCSEKIKDLVFILLEDRAMRDGMLLEIPHFDSPLQASLCGLHSKRYADRIRDMICNLPTCHGRGFTCVYQEQSFRFVICTWPRLWRLK